MLEDLAQVPPGLWGLLGTVFGAYIVHLGQKRLKATDDRSTTNRDYRGEISELVARLDSLENEVTFWRNRYYEEQEHGAMLRILLIQNGITPPPLIPVRPQGSMDITTFNIDE